MPAQTAQHPWDFPQTHLAEVDDLKRGEMQALGGWYIRYKGPLIAHARFKLSLSAERAECIFHDFIHDKLVQKRCVANYDPGKGRFRNFILKVFVNYVIDGFKKEGRSIPLPPDDRAFERVHRFGSVKGKGGQSIPLPSNDPDSARLPASGSDKGSDQEWPRAVLAATAERLKNYYERRGQLNRWELFECRVFLPIVEGTKPTPYPEVIKRCGLKSPNDAYLTILRAKDKFDEFLHEVLREYAGTERAAAVELQELKDLCRAGSRRRKKRGDESGELSREERP